VYLKSIEIQGFKSFADKTVINFEKGITAIVGPNGSGKSNVTEALRWVLGEQSAKNLRGGRMPDIIFAGTLARQPLNIAEVNLILDNSDHYLPLDFDEISITRSLSRSGESDFFINRTPSRLKDITDLFMDSGLGRESFSIISQGKVESIFNSKPEERRGIFEEAAGVLKYKNQKKQAENKLLETEENLARLQDILYELEGQLKPLSKQKQTAEKFLRLQEDLAKIDISLTVHELVENKNEWEKKKIELKEAQFNFQERKAGVELTEQKLAEFRDERNSLDQLLVHANKDLLEITERIKESEGQLCVLQERSLYFVRDSKDLEEKVAASAQRLDSLERKLTQLEEELREREVFLENDKAKLAEKSTGLAELSKSSTGVLADLRKKYLAAHEESLTKQNELQNLAEKFSQKEAQKIETSKLASELQIELVERKKNISCARAKFLTLQKEQCEQRINWQKAQNELQTRQANLKNLQEELVKVSNLTQMKSAHLQSMKQIEANYQGYFQGIRDLLQKKAEFSGIIGSVAELIDVLPRYQLAVEIALGNASQHVVVQDEASAKEAISYLKRRRLGRATFLPLTTIKPRLIAEHDSNFINSQKGFLGVASKLIGCPENIRNVVHNLLGKTLIADSLENANELARKLKFRYRVLSLEGDVFSAGGSITGGASKSMGRNSLFTNNQELQNLTRETEQLSGERDKLAEQIEEFQHSVNDSEKICQKLRDLNDELRLKENDQEHLLKNLTDEHQRLLEKNSETTNQEDEIKNFLAKETDLRQDLMNSLEEAQRAELSLTKQMEQVEEATSKNEEKCKEIQQVEQKLREVCAVSLERLKIIKQKKVDKKAEKNKLKAELIENQENLLAIVKNSAEQKVSVEKLTIKLTALRNRQDELKQGAAAFNQKREELVAQVANLEQELSRENARLQELQVSTSNIEAVVERVGSKLDYLLNYLENEYTLTFEDAQKRSVEIVDEGCAKTKVSRLKRESNSLGVVNLNAIEQFAEVNDRFVFLNDQRADLLTAKNSLHETMAEMDEEVKIRFKNTFDEISLHFQKTFPKLFGGGCAKLILTDSENLLTTGIEIEAQPSGKRLQNLSLLSGGERALTSLALLFAIIEVRPVPFAVLDEVEAALDEANVIRFGQYLTYFKESTQFIVVTHRKGTMLAAEVLFGIAMQEQGVSKIVSVKLSEVDKENRPVRISS